MPHPAKKSKTLKATKLASRVKQRKKEKDEFDHIQYLRSQLDEHGNPLDIMHTDEELLNNEQKFMVRLIKKLSLIDLRSIAIYIEENYDEDSISKMVDYYYSNKENKTWADSFFMLTYKCLGVLNLDNLLTEKLLENTSDIIETVEETEKPKMTKELAEDLIIRCSIDLPELNFFELVNTVLLMYSQNVEYCIYNKEAGLTGGVFPIILLLVSLALYIFLQPI